MIQQRSPRRYPCERARSCRGEPRRPAHRCVRTRGTGDRNVKSTALAHVPAKWTRFADKEHAPPKESRAHSVRCLSRSASTSPECALDLSFCRQQLTQVLIEL